MVGAGTAVGTDRLPHTIVLPLELLRADRLSLDLRARAPKTDCNERSANGNTKIKKERISRNALAKAGGLITERAWGEQDSELEART
jgi:hypothetical protein